MMLLLKMVIIFLYISSSSEALSIDDLSIEIENEFSKYINREVFKINFPKENILVQISSIKHIFTYETKRISKSVIEYYQPIFYYIFDLSFTIPHRRYISIEIIRKGIILKHEVESFDITRNDENQCSYALSIKRTIAQFEEEFDLMHFSYFKKIIEQIPSSVTDLLYKSMQDSFTSLFKDKFPSDSESIFNKFVKRLIDHGFYKVEEDDMTDYYGTHVLIRNVKYDYIIAESKYNTQFINVLINIDFHRGYEGYGDFMRVNHIDFGVFGLNFGNITVDNHHFLKISIPIIFQEEFKNVHFDQ